MYETHKQAGSYLTVLLASDIVLTFLLIGLLLIPIHILAYISNKFMITKNSVILKRGILSSDTVEIPFTKINSITIKQGPLGKMFGYGDILIMTGNDVSGIPFKGIANPEQVKAKIQSAT